MTSTLTIDVGNSHMTIVIYENRLIRGTHRIHTRPFFTAAQLVTAWTDMLTPYQLLPQDIALAISSVVPDYNDLLQSAATSLNCASFHWVSGDSPHGFHMLESVRHEIGADLIAGLVGARWKCSGPLVVIDAGTATTLALLSSDDEITGVAILPGLKTQIRTLMEKAPHLAERIAVSAPTHPYGTNTTEAIQSGIVYGHAYLVEGFIQAYRQLPGFHHLTALGCGGLLTTFSTLCPSLAFQEAHLVNDGCLILSERLQKEAL